MEHSTGAEAAKAEAVTIRIPKDVLSDIIKFDDQVRKAKGISLLTPHARVLFWLSLNGTGSMNDALIASNTSYASFFNVLRRLKAENLVSADKDELDSRVRRLSLVGQV